MNNPVPDSLGPVGSSTEVNGLPLERNWCNVMENSLPFQNKYPRLGCYTILDCEKRNNGGELIYFLPLSNLLLDNENRIVFSHFP